MAFFDKTLEFAPVQEQSTDPVLPEDRFVFELIGLERSEPDQYRKDGGVKWTWRVFYEDGRPFVFQDEQYQFWRTTGVNANGAPLVNIGTYAHDWASAMLGRQLGIDDRLNPDDLYGRRMSAMVVWEKQKKDASRKTIKLASLRHVPIRRTALDRTTVSADPSSADVDRALILSKLPKQIARLKKLDAAGAATAAEEWDEADKDGPLADLQRLLDRVDAAIAIALDSDD